MAARNFHNVTVLMMPLQMIKCTLSKYISQCQVLNENTSEKKHQKIEFYLSKFLTRDHPKKYLNLAEFGAPDCYCPLRI